MKQILIVSGKGGTGKTFVSGALAFLAKNKIMVDCDVDAADLHLLLNPEIIEKHEFKAGVTAILNKNLCMRCGECITMCKFDAINDDYIIEPFSCEGCGFCIHMCRFNAINMIDKISGEYYISNTKYGTFIHAKLGIAEENSGKLVSEIRQVAKKIAKINSVDYIIIDGPPGIGCSVIASMSGVDLVVIVTEPTMSGIHDAKRVIELANHFKIPVKLIINKFDINFSMSNEIKIFCIENQIPIIGKIPFDKIIVESIVKGLPILEIEDGKIKEEFIKIWDNLKS